MGSNVLTAVLYFGSVVIGVIMFLKHVVEVSEIEESVKRSRDEALRQLEQRRQRKKKMRHFVSETSLEATAKSDIAAGLKRLLGK